MPYHDMWCPFILVTKYPFSVFFSVDFCLLFMKIKYFQSKQGKYCDISNNAIINISVHECYCLILIVT